MLSPRPSSFLHSNDRKAGYSMPPPIDASGPPPPGKARESAESLVER